MADVRPLRGVRYHPDHVRLGGVLAPPYDVIDDAQREALYGRDLRNIVRVDHGAELADDEPGVNDRYSRAAEFLESWRELGVLVQDATPSLYIADHEFMHPAGELRRRRGILATVPARPWRESDLRPHERTLFGPKQDRLALLRATRMQTSAVFALWSGAAELDDLLEAATAGRALLGGRTDGEMGSEKHLLWRVDDPGAVAAIRAALAPAALYVADGHHRYETAAAYAAERRDAAPDESPDAPYEFALVYLAAAGDPSLAILPTHRLVRAATGVAFSLDDLWARLDDRWEIEPVAGADAGLRRSADLRASHHAFLVVARDGLAVLKRARDPVASPRQGLDASVLETEVLVPAGVTGTRIEGGALAYTRVAEELVAAVGRGEAELGFGLQPVTAGEVIAVADAGETMPQKSTYFYPKVPTGLVLHPV